METLIFKEHPAVELATNRFVNVPIILQYEETPLLQVVKTIPAGFTTEIPIYHSDGTYLAKVVGSQLHATPEGTKAGVILRHPDRKTVCEMGGKTLFVIERTEAAALKTEAELFAPYGVFVRASNKELAQYVMGQEESHLQIGKTSFKRCTFTGCKIGIWFRKGGECQIAVRR